MRDGSQKNDRKNRCRPNELTRSRANSNSTSRGETRRIGSRWRPGLPWKCGPRRSTSKSLRPDTRPVDARGPSRRTIYARSPRDVSLLGHRSIKVPTFLRGAFEARCARKGSLSNFQCRRRWESWLYRNRLALWVLRPFSYLLADCFSSWGGCRKLPGNRQADMAS